MRPSLILATIVVAGPLGAQQRRPVIPQPSTPSSVTAGTHGPSMPPRTSRSDPVSRVARSDTTEILEALARRLRIQDRDVINSSVTILADTAWVTLRDPKFQGATHRLERHHSWKLVEP